MTPEGREAGSGPIIGIPAALPLLEELPFWKRFFAELALKVVTSEGLRTAVKTGRELTGAEFCAPVTALHGHVRYLAETQDEARLTAELETCLELCHQRYPNLALSNKIILMDISDVRSS